MGAHQRVALGDFHLIAVMTAGAVQPGAVVQSRHLDDQGVSVPAACGPPHPGVKRCWTRVFEVNIPYGACKLIGNKKIVITLDDLKRVWQVGRPRHSRHIALNFRIAGDPVGRVVFFDPASLLVVRNPAATFNDTHGTGYRQNGPGCECFCSRHSIYRTFSHHHRVSRNVRF